MGSGTSSTSKAAFISPSIHTHSHIDYLFAAISVDQPLIDYSGSCGNLAAAAGLYAILHNMVPK
jgi:hypothetical protein